MRAIESSRACEDTSVAAAPADRGLVAEPAQDAPACADVSAMGPNGHFELAALLEQGEREESNDRAAAVMAEDPAAE